VLIVKLDAMGDVLRSTALLPPIVEAHPRAAITWITRTRLGPGAPKDVQSSAISGWRSTMGSNRHATTGPTLAQTAA